jgi:hypothetical protein
MIMNAVTEKYRTSWKAGGRGVVIKVGVVATSLVSIGIAAAAR